jgi:hypothetical protein
MADLPPSPARARAPGINYQAILSAVALVILGWLGSALVFHEVPPNNREILSMIVGAIGGALTFAGVSKAAAAVAAHVDGAGSGQ